MFRLRRLYFDSIGVADNRFSDLIVDVTDIEGQPTDAIVWLRNGAGKTTMLSLLLALILPDRRDFLATKTKKRTLEDLVLAGDTAHVVAEWVDPTGHLLLTGGVYEWESRVRPRDYNGAGKDRLRRAWWCVSPDPVIEGSALDDLPCTFRTHGRYDLDRFRSHIRALATKGVNAVVADQTITEWHSALRERRFDPELFHYFTEVNAAEGGIDGLFSGIDSPGAFVRYLLRFVCDRQRVAPVRELLSDTALEIAKRPVYLAERDFCSQARPKVAALGGSQETLGTASKARDDVRTAAAGYKRALLDAAVSADRLHEIADGRYQDLDAAFRDTRNVVDTARRRRDEYRRLAAEFRVNAAKSALRDAENTVGRLAVEVNAWSAVEDHAALTTAQAELRVRNATLLAADADARPLVESLSAAKAVMAGALDTALAAVGQSLDTTRFALAEATQRKTSAETERWKVRQETMDLSSEQTELDGIVDRFQSAKTAAITDGVVGAGERIDAAVGRLREELDVAGRHVARLVAERDALAGAITVATACRDATRDTAERLVGEHQAVAGELAAVEQRAARIADQPRLRDLLQTDSVDLLISADDATTRLDQAVAAADLRIIEDRAASAEDGRAVHALATQGLLPPRPAVSHVLDELARAGITAHSGWRYLAEHIDVDEHAERIAELPEVVDGVVVYGDPAEAAARIDEDVDDLVVLTAATAFRHRHDSCVVLGPAAAQHDPAVAATELERRRELLATRSAKLASLESRRNTDAEIAAQIRALVSDLPTDGIAGLRRRTADAAEAAEQARGEEIEARRHREELVEQRAATVDQLAEQRTALAGTETALERVRTLAMEEREVVEPTIARLEAIPDLLQILVEAKDRADTAYRQADQLIDRLRGDLHRLDTVRRNWANQRSILPDVAISTDLDVEAAAATVTELATQLRERFPEGQLRHAVAEAERAVRKADDDWQRHESPVRERATELVGTPTGQHKDLRVAALVQARVDQQEANRELGAVQQEHKTASDELREASPRGRLRHIEILDAPTDRADAQRLAAEANEEATRLQTRVGQLASDRDAAGVEAERARNRAGMLRDQADRLRGVEPGPVAVGDIPVAEDDARRAVGELARDLDAAEAAYATAFSARAQCADQLRVWAGADRFASVAEDEHGQAVRRLRELFRGDQLFGRVAVRAAEFADDLAVREKAIDQQLAQVETHKRNVVHRLSDLVDDSLGVLGRASALSELPEDIGPWGHQRFLVVDARQRPSREQVALRVGELVDRMVSGGKIELDPVELLWRATEASVVDGFRATVLKPAPDQPIGRTPVEDMRKWSGGENLTASLALFCVLARLRAEQRTGGKAGIAGGLVPLDNPLGKANYLPFLELQRRVADASGVQLVFWTGIGDLGAVTAFPRIAAMHKRPSTTRPGRAYVRSDPASSFTAPQVVDVVTSVRHDR
jgi:hypothetical protein